MASLALNGTRRHDKIGVMMYSPVSYEELLVLVAIFGTCFGLGQWQRGAISRTRFLVILGVPFAIIAFCTGLNYGLERITPHGGNPYAASIACPAFLAGLYLAYSVPYYSIRHLRYNWKFRRAMAAMDAMDS